tara:strand:+ start:5510 stop:6109 length:600 start_codon:yes stop_codon:yes gene_type:complete
MIIKISNLNKSAPYQVFNELLNKAIIKQQKGLQVIAISSFSHEQNEVNSRYVNLKYINNDEWSFFSNYNSKKSSEFSSHDQISTLLYWDAINVQIRMKSNIVKSSKKISDEHFSKRSKEKNALAISSFQSNAIESYDKVISKYEKVKEKDDLFKRPNYWGGYSFTPYYFEFWEGHNSRLNKRDAYEKNGDNWHHSILQP